MKICHVITRMIVGGAQENTLLSALRQHELGHEVVLVTGPSPGPEGELLKRSGEIPFEIVTMPDLVREVNIWTDWRARRALRKFFQEREFDVVHTHSSKAGIVGRHAAHDAGVPFVTHTVHGQAFHRKEKAWKNALYIWAERGAAKVSDRIFAVAQAMVDQCVEAKVAPKDKYQVVYSGMRLEQFRCTPDAGLRQSLGIPEGVPVIGTLARLFPLKGYEFVIPAARKLLASCPEAHFLLIGDGPMRAEIEEEQGAVGLLEHFHFAGLVSPDRVGAYLALTDQLWHLSLREGLPRSVVQSLASGHPAIGFRLDGTPEVVLDGETGFCVAPEDVEAVAEHGSWLLKHPEEALRMGARGRDLVTARFDWRHMGDVLTEAYERGLAAKKNVR